MILVMLVHITSSPSLLECLITSMINPLFFIASGFLTAHTGGFLKHKPARYTISLAKHLFIPYFCFSFIGLLIRFVYNLCAHKDQWELLYKEIKKTLSLVGVAALWFIPVFFFGKLVFFFIMRSHIILRIIYLIITPFIFYGFGILNTSYSGMYGKGFVGTLLRSAIRIPSVSLLAAWFMILGYLAYTLYNRIPDNAVRLAIGVFFSALTVWLSWLNGAVHPRQTDVGCYPILFYVTALTGSFGVILIIDWLYKHIPLGPLRYLGINSITIMCTNSLFLLNDLARSLWKLIVHRIPGPSSPTYALHCLAILVILIILEIPIILIVNQAKRLCNKYKKSP